MHTFPFIFIPLHSSDSSIPFLYEDSHPDSPHSHPDFPHSHPYSLRSHSSSQHSCHSPHSVPRFPFRLLQRAFVDSSIYIQIISIRSLPEMFLQSENNNNNTNKHYFESTFSSLQFFFAAAKNEFKPYKAI